MDKKLTLKLDGGVIEQAKRYARERGESLSGLVERYFRALVEVGDDPQPGDIAEPAGLVGELTGLLEGAQVEELEAEYASYLSKKYS